MFPLFRATALAAALATALSANAAIDLNAPIPVGPQVKVGKLANGLTYYIHHNGKPEHRVELRLIVKAGSVLEDDDQQGLAHMLEHMAFNGSTHFKKQELVSYLESIGVKFGADLNAVTMFDETIYMLPVPTDRKENVETGFTVLEDWAHGITLNADDIDKERPIILQEARERNTAQLRALKALLPKEFNGSRYTLRVPIGSEDVIRHAQPETLRRFYHDWYRPDLMAVVVVGDIEPAEAERLVKAHFAKLKNPPHERPRAYPEIAPRKTAEALVFTDEQLDTEFVRVHYPARPEPVHGSYGDLRTNMVEQLVGTMLNARLGELAQQPNAPYRFAAGSYQPLGTRYQEFVALAVPTATGAAPALKALEGELQRVRQFGFSQAELDRARMEMLSGTDKMLRERTTTDSAQFANDYLRHFLNGAPIPDVEAKHRLVHEMAPTIGLDDVNASARAAFPQDAARLVAFTGNTKNGPPPAAEQLLADANAAAHAQATARVEKALAQHLMERPAKPGRITAETRDDALGLTRLTLSNGVQVVLKPSSFRKDQVLLSARRFGGMTLFDPQDQTNAQIAGPLAQAMGLKDFAPVDLAKMLTGRNADVTVGLSQYMDEINGHSGSGAEDLETMFQMLWLRFDGVRRDEGVYHRVKDNMAQRLRNLQASPDLRLIDAALDATYAPNPYKTRLFDPVQVERFDLDRSITLYRQRFGSAKDLTFVLVGDFDVAAIKPLVAAYLGTLPTPDLHVGYRDVGLRPVTGVVKKEIQVGIEPKSTVLLTFTGPATWSPAEMQRMDALVEVLNLRTLAVLREKLGLIYSGEISGSVDRVPYGHYNIDLKLPTAADKVDQLIAAMFAEIDSIRKDGPTQAELDKVKANWRQRHEQELHENEPWMYQLQGSLLDGTPASNMLTRMDQGQKLTVADLRATAQRYLDKDNYVQVVMKPETGAQPAAVASK